MPRLCERPGCSSLVDIAYGIDADRLVVWLETLPPVPVRDQRSGVLCRRHADSMVVPLGWTLDDRREPTPRLFRPPPIDTTGAIARPSRKKSPGKKAKRAKDDQLPLHEPDEPPPSVVREPVVSRLFETPARTPRKPRAAEPSTRPAPVPHAPLDPGTGDVDVAPWYPAFDEHDDLDGLLVSKGPLMSRAFGNPQPRPPEPS